ncbi:hypothetical protein [Enterobacter wuhouensis]|uniref:hypothetical protein n=1 Tax=Enterobacter wuhouensis TaxID=2529381 RepID=UPI002FDD5952
MSDLVKRGHDQAAELKASCGAVDVRNVAQLISDLAAQLDVQRVRVEESQREFRAADAAIENLQMQVEKLAAENAGLNNFIASSCYVLAGEEAAWYPAIDHAPETPATNQLSIAESQFLTDVMTAAGLLSCGKRDTQLAQRLADFCVSKRGGSNPAQLRKGVQS